MKAPVTWIIVGFVFSRALLYALGFTFYGSFVHRLWQGIDIELLKSDLVRSILYSHGQPPGFNVITGILAKAFPEKYMLAFQLVNLGMSMLTAVLLCLAVEALTGKTKIAALIGALFILNPAVMLYESIYSYTILTIFLIACLMFTLCKFVEVGKLFWWSTFAWVMGVVVLTRSSYHLAWMILSIFLIVYFLRDQRWRRMLRAAIIPVLICVLWYGKNWVWFDSFTSSTWLGMNLARVITPHTALGAVGPFKALDLYNGMYTPSKKYSEVPLLRERTKAKFGYVNYHHADYVLVSRRFREEATTEIVERPEDYLRRVAQGFVIYFSPATHAPFLEKNFAKIDGYAAFINFDGFGFERFKALDRRLKDEEAAISDFMRNNGFSLTGALPPFLLYIICIAFISLQCVQNQITAGTRVVCLFSIWIITYGMLVGNFFEFGENNRFRLETSPAFYLLLGFSMPGAFKLLQNMLLRFKRLKF